MKATNAVNDLLISDALRQSDFFSLLDFQFAEFVTRIEGHEDSFLYGITAILSRSVRRKDVCLDLESLPTDFPEALAEDEGLRYPSLDVMLKKLRQYSVVGEPGEKKPVILDGKRLYMYRFFRYEDLIASEVMRRAGELTEFNGDDLSVLLDELFPPEDGGVDWQRCAAINAASRQLSVITGGPGSGKTTTVVRILMILMNDHLKRSGTFPSIALAAPTGKAAAHMQQSVSSAIARIEHDADMSVKVKSLAEKAKEIIPASGLTLHRLFSTATVSGDRRILPYDIIVVDECSMADIAVFSRFIEMTGHRTRVLILGDKDQLSSVEAGSVLGDICAHPGDKPVYPALYADNVSRFSPFEIPGDSISKSAGGLSGAVTYLTKCRRFAEDSGIGKLAGYVNEGDGERAYALFGDSQFKDLHFTEIQSVPPGIDVMRYKPMRRMIITALKGFLPDEGSPHFMGGFCDVTSPDDALRLQSRFQILCAMRNGPFGSLSMNQYVEEILRAEGRITGRGSVYHGLPVIVTENDHALRLYNGDAGIVYGTDVTPRAYFSSGDTVRSVLPLQISAWEKGYALTVHKSQGSEYDHVVVFLGPHDSRVVTRELIYTAVTRAKKSVHVLGRKDDFIAACARRITRESGLGDRLWKN